MYPNFSITPEFKPGDIISLMPSQWGEFGAMILLIIKCHPKRGYSSMVLEDSSDIFEVGSKYYVNLNNQVLYKVIG